MSGVRTIVFAKAPRPGLVKTRLIPALGAAGAALLAQRMLLGTLQTALDAKIGSVELCTEPAPVAPAWDNVALPAGIELTAQVEGDLGARLANAAHRALTGGGSVLLLGTDCLEISPELLRAAARELREFGAVLYRTVDGGYALLGLTRFDRRLFEDIPWSTADVALTTMRRFAELAWPVHVGSTLHDIDLPEDLARVPASWLPQV